jgi:hypothetical protein
MMDNATKQLVESVRAALVDVRAIADNPAHPNRLEIADDAADTLEGALAAYDARVSACIGAELWNGAHASMAAAAAGTSKALRDGTPAGTSDTLPAPWYTHGATGWLYETEDARNPLAVFANPEHARRIVACVNACAAIPTELLESLAPGSLDVEIHRAAAAQG